MCQKSQEPPTWPQFEHAIKRNFGGLETDICNPLKEFEAVIIPFCRKFDLANIPVEVSDIIHVMAMKCSLHILAASHLQP